MWREKKNKRRGGAERIITVKSLVGGTLGLGQHSGGNAGSRGLLGISEQHVGSVEACLTGLAL